MTVDEYFGYDESLRRMELVGGVVREPPAPSYGHQSIVTRITVLLDRHVREHRLGIVCVSPIDVVLDRERALVVQPDIVFVAEARRSLIDQRIWGAPDLVVEVMSRRTAGYDRGDKLTWYREYGVRECWLIDETLRSIEVVDCLAGSGQRFTGSMTVESGILAAFNHRVTDLFDVI
jgi:Uma2 family endonuclease